MPHSNTHCRKALRSFRSSRSSPTHRTSVPRSEAAARSRIRLASSSERRRRYSERLECCISHSSFDIRLRNAIFVHGIGSPLEGRHEALSSGTAREAHPARPRLSSVVTGASSSTRWTLRTEAPARLATSGRLCPAPRRTWIACRFRMSNILPPAVFNSESGPQTTYPGVARISGTSTGFGSGRLARRRVA
jgi:hypothetical protein